MTDGGTDPGEALVASTVFLTLGAAIVAFVALGWQPAALVLALGWLVVLPLTAILTEAVGPLNVGGDDPGEPSRVAADASEADAALAALRERYARGDIDEAEFERRVERLVATEDLDVTATRETAGGDLEGERERDGGGERSRGHRRESEREL